MKRRNIRQLFNGTVYLQAPLKAFELNERTLNEKYGLTVKKLDYNDDTDLEIWMKIIHSSYDDCHFTLLSAKKFLTTHPYMTDTESFVFFKKEIPIATVSIGRYKQNLDIGGDFRIGVTKSAQGHGYGRLCILYGFSKLAAKGIKNGESAIAFKRKESLQLHYSLGFRPQYDIRYLAEKNGRPWLKNLNFILKYRLYLSYRNFLRKERQKYITK